MKNERNSLLRDSRGVIATANGYRLLEAGFFDVMKNTNTTGVLLPLTPNEIDRINALAAIRGETSERWLQLAVTGALDCDEEDMATRPQPPTSTSKRVRVAVAADGNVDVGLSLPSMALTIAEEYATMLETTPLEVLQSYFEDSVDGLVNGIEDHCLNCWEFPTRKAAKAFIHRIGWAVECFEFDRHEDGLWGFRMIKPMSQVA